MIVPKFFRFLCLCLAALHLAGCASVHYSPGKLESSEKRLVFGKILLVRDGEEDVLSPLGTQISLGGLESTAEPLMVLESFEKDGSFHWMMEPGNYVLTMGLNPPTGDIVTCAFTVPEEPRACYFGELRMVGRKYFNTFSSANIRDVRVQFTDRFDAAAAELLRLEPGLDIADIGRARVADISTPDLRRDYFRAYLDAVPEGDETFARMHWERLAPGKEFSGKISGEHGVFRFTEGKSYYAAFVLPEGARSVSIESSPFLSGVMDRLRIFVPAALLLDETFFPVARLESVLTPVPARLLPPRPAHLAGGIDLTRLEHRPRYLILFTTEDLLRGARYGSRPGFVSIPGGAMLTGLSVPVGLDAWITGEISVEVTGP